MTGRPHAGHREGRAVPTESEPAALSRRGLLIGGGGVLAGITAGAAGAATLGGLGSPGAAPASPATEAPVPSRGRHQAGIDRPATPQRSTVLLVGDLEGPLDAERVLAGLAAIGERIDACTDPVHSDRRLLPDGPGDLTVTIGIGPRLVAAIDPGLDGAAALPEFAADAGLDPALRGGDLLISVCGSDAAALPAVADAVLAAAGGARRRWSQAGVRGAGEGTIARNPLGFHDGVIVPQGEAELDRSVWIGSGPAAGGTIAVVRRIRLDLERFRALPEPAQERVIGRSRASGAPLSGGGLRDEADLGRKTAEGEFLIPLRSHVRAAHPSFTGSGLMLRRGYAYSNATAPDAPADEGLLFVCFQHELEVFVRTQHRLDEHDALGAFSTVTASGSFLILPGRSSAAPLGAGLRG